MSPLSNRKIYKELWESDPLGRRLGRQLPQYPLKGETDETRLWPCSRNSLKKEVFEQLLSLLFCTFPWCILRFILLLCSCFLCSHDHRSNYSTGISSNNIVQMCFRIISNPPWYTVFSPTNLFIVFKCSLGTKSLQEGVRGYSCRQ